MDEKSFYDHLGDYIYSFAFMHTRLKDKKKTHAKFPILIAHYQPLGLPPEEKERVKQAAHCMEDIIKLQRKISRAKDKADLKKLKAQYAKARQQLLSHATMMTFKHLWAFQKRKFLTFELLIYFLKKIKKYIDII